MTLEQLRVFIAVAERQHMTRAAESLNLAQSAASAAIAALEGRHGAKLFNRVGRGIELTESGRLFLDEARAVVRRAEAAELKLAELVGLKRGTLNVQASKTISGYWLPRFLVNYRRAHPGIEVRLVVGNTAEVAASVLNGTTQLGFIEGAIDAPSLDVTAVAKDQLIVVTAPDHAWSSATRLDPDHLAAAEWVFREPGSGTRSVFEAYLESVGIGRSALNIVLELPTNEAVRGAVEAGLGATAISASVAVSSLEAELLVKAPIELPSRIFSVIRHTERELSRAAQALLDLIGDQRLWCPTAKRDRAAR